MFQYAAGLRVATEHNCELKVDTSILIDHSPGRHEVNRGYDLDVFNLDVAWASRSERRWFNPNGLSIPEKVLYRIRRYLIGNGVYNAPSFGFDQGLLNQTPPPRYIAGLWQSYRYLEPISDLLRRDFTFRLPLPSESVTLAASIKQSASVCLNVRRTDFVTTANSQSVLRFIGIEYYEKATKALISRVGSGARFFVFSDDIEWCRKELKWLPNNPVFVGHDYAGPKYSHYLQLMSLASHYIIPNSTFAWWAAWLSTKPEKVVIAPKQWFSDTSINTVDLCPSSWLRL